jgi:ferredoxin
MSRSLESERPQRASPRPLKVVIAGSGPAGVFAARGALGANVEIQMIDPGLELPAETSARAAEIASRAPAEWSDEDLAFVKGQLRATPSGIAEKTLYGSDFSSRALPSFPRTHQDSHLYVSYAKGGLSNIWGRGVEPIAIGEHERWPFFEELKNSYREVLGELPFVAADDDLANVFPLYSDRYQEAPLSSQFLRIHRTLLDNVEALNAQGVHFGRSRFLIEFAENDERRCRLCNLCMYGCPYGAMYATPETLESLEHSEKFRYQGGTALESFSDDGEGVTLRVLDVATGARSEIRADRLVLAAGAANTTRIAMASLGVARASMKTSEMFLMPILSLRGSRKLLSEATYSLAQLTLVVRDPSISGRSLVVHLFGYNPIFRDAVESMLPGWLQRPLKPLIEALVARVMIGSTLVHSDESSGIELTLDRDNLRVAGHRHPATGRITRRLGWKLLKNAVRTGLVPLPFATRRMEPGGSVHYGASLPIGGDTPLSTRSDGSLRAATNVYVADAASLPDIPAGSFTLTLMANAHRIGRALGRTARPGSGPEKGLSPVADEELPPAAHGLVTDLVRCIAIGALHDLGFWRRCFELPATAGELVGNRGP